MQTKGGTLPAIENQLTAKNENLPSFIRKRFAKYNWSNIIYGIFYSER
jgi:hypothetical protein